MSATHPLHLVIACLAAVVAGAVNALAGGGTLLTFPVLTALGVPAVCANVTNTVALCPGYFGGILAQRRDLAGQRGRVLPAMAAGAVGGLVGGLLLMASGEKLFARLVPYLILGASALLAIQNPVKAWLQRRAAAGGHTITPERWAGLPIAVSAIYGGYFGAGLSVIVLAVLGLTVEENLTRLNALKQAIAFATNVAAALFFLFSGKVLWGTAAVMAVGALAGGAVGGRLAGRMKPEVLRTTVVVIGVTVGIMYLFR